jgi:hypothetical protein
MLVFIFAADLQRYLQNYNLNISLRVLCPAALLLLLVIGLVESTLRQRKGIRWKSPIKGTMWGRALLAVKRDISLNAMPLFFKNIFIILKEYFFFNFF